MKYKKTLLMSGGLLSLIAPISSVVSCNNDEDMKKTFAIVVSQQTNPFFQEIIDSARKEAASKGYKVVAFDSGNKASEELSNIDVIISKGYAGVIWNPVNAKGSKKAGEKLKDSNIPFTFVDRGIDNFNYNIARVATENKEMAKQIVIESVNAYYDKYPNISAKLVAAHLQGQDGASAAIARDSGYREAKTTLNANANKGLDDQGREDRADWQTKIAKEKIDAWNTSKTLQFIFAENDNMALGAIKSYEGTSSNYPMIVGFDGLPAAKEKIDQGKMYATVMQDTKEMGKISADILLEKILKDNTITSKSDYTKTGQIIELPGIIYKNSNWPSKKS